MKNLYRKWIFIVLFLVLIVSCSFSGPKSSDKTVAKPNTAFKVPDIPSVFNTPEQRIDFLMAHYWDNFNFQDTTTLKRPQVAEQIFANFLHVLSSVPPEKATKGISTLMQKAGVNFNMLQLFQSMGEKYLYDPNSPVRNEALYCTMLEFYLSSGLVSDAWKIRPQSQYDLAQKNKVGTSARDFSFSLKDGSISSLYDVKSKFLLLYFHNPGCTDCKIEREKIIASLVMQKLQKEGVLKVLSLYPDKDLTEWKKYYSELPKNWINGYDKQARINEEEIYDLKAIPSLYLLNEQKMVLLKDARFEEIEAYLSKL